MVSPEMILYVRAHTCACR